ncbi:MAG: bestrophin family ion channel [Robiginitalea sp.]|nr:bestrophin family ion channel [Robiginitalea sp.]
MILKKSRPYGFFLNAIKYKILAIVVLTLVVGYLDDVLYTIFDFDMAIPAFFGTAIILALAFRTNKAYNRWWEAKMIWESVVNSSRTWTRLVLRLLQSPEKGGNSVEELKEKMIFRQLAWNYILEKRLRGKPALQDMEKYLNQEDLSFLSGIDNANQGLLFLQSRDLIAAYKQGNVDLFQHIELEEVLRDLETAMGKAERIKKTHFPVLYDILFELSIYIFSALLTYAIRDSLTVFEATFSIIVTTLFMMMNEIARDMQDPFEDLPTDTPMLALSHEVERSVLQLLGRREMPEPIQQGNYYLK